MNNVRDRKYYYVNRHDRSNKDKKKHCPRTNKVKKRRKQQVCFFRRINQLLNNRDPHLIKWWNEMMRCSKSWESSCKLKQVLSRIPVYQVLKFNSELNILLQGMEAQLVALPPSHVKYNRHAKNYGIHIWCTVVDGGPHATNGFSGGIYLPRTFAKKTY